MEDDVMAKMLVDDGLWSLIESVLPKWTASPRGGQPRKGERLCLSGILFVLKTGIPWEDFPQEMGCCGMTLWNRLHEWQQAGVWKRVHRILLDKLQAAGSIDWSRAVVDSASVRAVGGAKKRAPTRRIAANLARNITSSPTPMALRSRRRSLAPTATMSRN
jgi:transposase